MILKAKYSLKDDKVELSPETKSLIKSLLEPDPLKRPHIEAVKNQPWLEEVYNGTMPIPEIFSDVEKASI